MGPEGYTTRQLAELLGTTEAWVRGWAREGVVQAARGAKGEYRFSFQDVVLLRTAKGLSRGLAPVRVRRALRELRRKLPAGRALTTLKITADGADVVVREGGAAFEAVSGQGLLDFDTGDLAQALASLETRTSPAARTPEARFSSEQWFELGEQLEEAEENEAVQAYRRALDADPRHARALINLGRILHARGDTREAADLYVRALDADPEDATALFNLGVALEDLGRLGFARRCYEHAVELEPAHADAHFNASRLCERLGDKPAAMRHLLSYRALTR